MKFRSAKEYLELSMTDGTPRKAFLTACVVGTILTAINHWETLLIGEYPPITKVILTYCVPYIVTTWDRFWESYHEHKLPNLQGHILRTFHIFLSRREIYLLSGNNPKLQNDIYYANNMLDLTRRRLWQQARSPM